jgi:hypothetical protein
MNPRAMLPVANAAGRASHARQVKGDDPGIPWSSRLGVGRRADNPAPNKKQTKVAKNSVIETGLS